MYCSKCGRENAPTASFCKSCGKPLKRSGSSAAAGAYRRQPAAVATPMATAAPAYAAPVPSAGKRAINGKTLKVAGAAIATIVVVVVAVCLILHFVASGGRSSAEKVAEDLSATYNKVLASSLSQTDLETAFNEMIDTMPSEAVDVALEKEGITNRADASKLLSGSSSASSVSSYASYLKDLDINYTFYVADSLSSSELDSINKSFQNNGVNLKATAGNKLGARASITARENVAGYAKGETVSQDTDESGMLAIQIDGKWYLWVKSIL